ncbi:MAG: hypothetical protein U1E15_11830 [Hyphomicrobiales bacterium]
MTASEIRRIVLPQDSLPQDDEVEDLQPIEEEVADAAEQPEAEEDTVTPSWFANTYKSAAPQDLAQRYRETRKPVEAAEEHYDHYRRRLEERFQRAKRMAEAPAEPVATMAHHAPPSRPSASANDDGLQRFRSWQDKLEQRKGGPAAPRLKRRKSSGRVAALFAGACVLGAAAGYGSTQVPAITDKLGDLTKLLGVISALWAPGAPAPAAEKPVVASAGGTTVLPKKAIKMPKVTVADASGPLNAPIPLSLQADSTDVAAPLALRISGLPADAYLTKGTQVASGEWMLKPGDENGVQLVVPRSQDDQIGLSVAPVESATGEPAAPPQELTVALDLKNVNVIPANAPPESQSKQKLQKPLPAAVPVPLEIASSDGQQFLDQGNEMMNNGDVIAARQYFIKASEQGLAEGAYGAGRTYDPSVFAELKIEGLQPDKAKAADWYRKAAAGGAVNAKDALEKLTGLGNSP